MQRSIRQNKSLHVYLQMVADDMNAAGHDFKRIVRLPIIFTKENIKEYMFKPVMNSLYPDKKSTTELSTLEIQNVYEVFNAAISVKFGVGHDWPSEENLDK